MRRELADELVMNIVELALAQPVAERDSYLENACGGDPHLLAEVRGYVEWEARMGGFLLDTLYPAPGRNTRFEAGELLDGRFRIIRKIAEGGMGLVYEARDERLDRRIAIKCAKPGHGNRLPPEVRHATEISHPNVCKIFEIHTAESEYGEVDFITMEFLDGETLASRLNRGPMPEQEARALARQLCAGVAEAHRNGVIHGDLKTNNIILTTGADGLPRAVITDFGLARKDGSPLRSAQSGDTGGTPGYMAPELWKGERASVASDIYALGVILYEMIGGRRPCDAPVAEASGSTQTLPGGASPASYWRARLNEPPAAVHDKWDRVLVRCLDPDASRRFATAADVARALEPPATRRRLLYAAAAVILAVVSGAVTYQRATAPARRVRLAVLPFQADPTRTRLADSLLREASRHIANLRGSPQTAFTMIPLDNVLRAKAATPEEACSVLHATHVLQASMTGSAARNSIRSRITDCKSQATLQEWAGVYSDGQAGYAGVALAGVVTEAFRLPASSETPKVTDAARGDYQQGLAAVRRYSGSGAALASFERAVKTDPGNPFVWAGLSEAQWMTYAQTDDKVWLQRAEESVREAQARNPDVAEVHRAAGLVDVEYGLYEKAIRSYRRAIELDPGNSDAYRRMGQAFEKNGQFDDALAAFRKAVEIEPAYFRNYQSLGSHYVLRGNNEEAAAQYRKAVALAPQEDYLHFRLALALKNIGRFDEAEAELRTAITLKETARSLHELGSVLIYRHRDREAAACFARALALNPDALLTAAELGLALRRSGQIPGATRALRAAQSIAERDLTDDPRNSYSRGILAWVCAMLGDRSRAESEIAQALRLTPEDANARWLAVVTYEALGQRGSTLGMLSRFTPQMLADVARWPVLDGLQKDPDFQQLLVSNPIRAEAESENDK
jgi:tetratricopeptide (TPR) repeat protein/TolB-like protein